MDLRHARTFVTVAELGTVSKAALRLRIAQPALSRQIGDLEDELGLKLFDRVGRRLTLTGEGEQLLNDCRSLLACAGVVGEHAELLKRGNTGVLKVAASPQFIESVISTFLHHYTRCYPGVEVRLFEAVGQDNLAMLERGEIHLGQNLLHAVEPSSPRFASHPIGSVGLLAAHNAPLGSRGSIDIGRLASTPLLTLEAGFSIRRTFDAACRLAGLRPNIVFASRAPHTLLALAKAGHGTAIIPSTLRTHSYGLEISRITYRGRPLSEPLTIYSDRRRSLPPYATAFCEMLAEHARNVLPTTRPAGPEDRATRRAKVSKTKRRA